MLLSFHTHALPPCLETPKGTAWLWGPPGPSSEKHPDLGGTYGYRNSFEAKTPLCSQAGDPMQPQGGDVGAQPPPALCVIGQGMWWGPGITCACDSCGSERKRDTQASDPTSKGLWGLAKTQRITQRPTCTPAGVGGCQGEGDTLQGTPAGLYHEEGVVILFEVRLELAGFSEQGPAVL